MNKNKLFGITLIIIAIVIAGYNILTPLLRKNKSSDEKENNSPIMTKGKTSAL